MKCFECGKGNLVTRVVDIEGEVRGEKVLARTEATVCDKCGAQFLNEQQTTAYGIASADAYREKKGLLTSKQLKALRKRFGMNQLQFARHVGVSSPSVKRWETGLVQDEANDALIRLRTDLYSARKNVQELEERLGEKPLSRSEVVKVVFVRPPEVSPWEMEQEAVPDAIAAEWAGVCCPN